LVSKSGYHSSSEKLMGCIYMFEMMNPFITVSINGEFSNSGLDNLGSRDNYLADYLVRSIRLLEATILG
jgi:hypothetical protein